MITPTELGGDLYVGGRPPKGWRSLRLKWTTRLCQNGIWGDEPDGENDVAVVRVADFVRVKLRVGNDIPTLRSVLPQQREGRLLRRGDLLIEKSGGGELQPVGTVVLFDSEREAVCSNFIAVMPVPDGYDSRFLCYLHAALYRAKINTRSIKQTTGIQNLDSYSYLSEHVAVPKLEIQQEIADFLDRETGLIDDLRAKQKRLTDRLEEQLQAVIHRLVTRGLKQLPVLKRSGVEWLGEIPQHWEIFRIGALYRESCDAGNDGLPILSVSIHTGVSDRQLEEDELDRKVLHIEDTSKYQKVAPNDLVYNMMRAWQGGFGAVTVPGMVSPAYVVARPKRPLVTKFIELLLRTPSAIEEMRRHSYGVADFRLRLYWDRFKTLQVAVPPLSEQREIVEGVLRETEPIDALAKMIAAQQERLAEFRSALITAAVTGQIDVRNYRRQEVAVCQ